MAAKDEAAAVKEATVTRVQQRSASAKPGKQHINTIAAGARRARSAPAGALARKEATRRPPAAQSRLSRRRRVALPGLQLLCAVARERDDGHGGSEALQRLCAAAEEERRAVAQRRCDLLYAESKARRERAVARRAAQEQQTVEAERTSCTFIPALTVAPSHDTAESAIDNFLQRCKAWQERTAAKLEARSRALDEEARGELWTRSDEARGARSARSFLASCRADDGDAAEQVSAVAVVPPACEDEGLQRRCSHVPITHELEQQAWAYLQQLTRHMQAAHAARDDDEAVPGRHNAEQDSGTSNEGQEAMKTGDTHGKPRRSMTEFLHDVEADLQRRAKRAAARAAQEAAEQAERCVYEPVTGRPLFTPNALPTMTKNGERVPFDRLSRLEQTQLLTTLRRQHADPALLRWLAERVHARHDEAADGAEGRDNVQADGREAQKGDTGHVLQRLLERSAESEARRQATLARLRAEAASAAPFQPRITARSSALARRRTAGVKIYDRPLPHRSSSRTSATTTNNNNTTTVSSGHDSTGRRVGSVYDERGAAAASAGPHVAPSSDAHMTDMLRRSEAWLQARAQRRRRAYAEHMAQELQECTFTPQRAVLHELAKSGDAAAVSHVTRLDNAASLSRSGRRASQCAAAEDEEQTTGGAVRTPGTHGGTARTSARTLDRLAMAADARLQHELQQLQARATSHAAQMQWPCGDTRGLRRGSAAPGRTCQELTLRSAPRLASRDTSQRVRQQSRLRTLSRSFDAHKDDDDDDSLYASPIAPVYDDGEATSRAEHSPSVRRRLHDEDAGRNDYEYDDDEDTAVDDWSELDAQTDAILQRLAHTPSLH